MISLTFYESYYEVGQLLDDRTRREYYDAIVEYFFTGIIPDGLSRKAVHAFNGVVANLDKSIERAEAGSKGGISKAQNHYQNLKQNSSKTRSKTKNKTCSKTLPIYEDEDGSLNNKNSFMERSGERKTFDEIVDFLNLKTGKNFRSRSEYVRRHITARLNEGFTVDDFKTVIETKTSQWKNDPKMRGYLRPETLFSTKFESYLNEKPKGAVSSGFKFRQA